MKPTKTLRFEDLPDILTVAEASALLRIAKNAAYEMVQRRAIPAVRIGRRVLIPKSGLAQLLGVPSAGNTQVDREGPRRQAPGSNLTLRGSFVITLHLENEAGTPK